MKQESIIFDTDNKRVLFYKDCQKCVHLPVCKYREAQVELMYSSLMKEMFGYRGAGNDGFDLHTNCKYFVHSLRQVAKDNPTVLNTTYHDITERIVNIFVHEKLYPQVKFEHNLDYDTVLYRDSFTYKSNHTLVHIKIALDSKRNELLLSKEFELEHILNDWTYVDMSNNLISD